MDSKVRSKPNFGNAFTKKKIMTSGLSMASTHGTSGININVLISDVTSSSNNFLTSTPNKVFNFLQNRKPPQLTLIHIPLSNLRGIRIRIRGWRENNSGISRFNHEDTIFFKVPNKFIRSVICVKENSRNVINLLLRD